MTHNTGMPYELVTQQIFLILVNQDAVRNIDVRHDVVLQGKTAKHQIDVYWEFEVAGIRYATVVQAKDWSTPVNQGELLKFKAVLDDLPGQPRGIVVTRSGYQGGAEEFAKAHGILLFQLIEQPAQSIVATEGSFGRLRQYTKQPDHFDASGQLDISKYLKNHVVELVIFDPAFSDSQWEVDPLWLSEQKDLHGDAIISEARNVKFQGRPRDLKFYDEARNPVGDMQDNLTSFVREMEKTEVMSQRMIREFDTPTFISTSSKLLPFLKIKAFSSSVTLTAREPIEIFNRLPNIVSFVLKNLNDNTERVLDVDTSQKRIDQAL